MRSRGLLGDLLPAGFACAEAFGDVDRARLHPEEEPAIAGAVASRRREYATTRHLAAVALDRLGHPGGPVRTGPGREPLWPDGIVGSLTHCEGYRAAAVAPRSLVASVGVDAEPHAPLPAEVLPLVTLAQERAGWEGLPGDVAWDRLVFSAKESVYKAWYPLTGQWLGFEDAVVSLRPAGTGPDRGDFEASLLVPPAVVAGREVGVFRGRYLVDRGLVVTAVLVGH